MQTVVSAQTGCFSARCSDEEAILGRTTTFVLPNNERVLPLGEGGIWQAPCGRIQAGSNLAFSSCLKCSSFVLAAFDRKKKRKKRPSSLRWPAAGRHPISVAAVRTSTVKWITFCYLLFFLFWASSLGQFFFPQTQTAKEHLVCSGDIIFSVRLGL